MTATLVALYGDIAVARQVIEALVKADFARSSIGLITNDAHNQYGRYLKKRDSLKGDSMPAASSGFGAEIGALNGLLVGLDAMMIPGIGLAIAAGPIQVVLRGANAGASSIIDALIRGGVPQNDAPYYAEGIRNGGTLVTLATVDRAGAEDIMQRTGSVNVHEHIHLWQHSWKGLGAGFAENVNIIRTAPIRNVSPTLPVTQPRKPRSYRN